MKLAGSQVLGSVLLALVVLVVVWPLLLAQ